ncbi:MAG: L,D-transpeptidase [Paracoccus sp. (in: a-proteobacteria)]|nr:L,D-transpeptidase [Paracoccus sp. (in: a-proteobacteria)]
MNRRQLLMLAPALMAAPALLRAAEPADRFQPTEVAIRDGFEVGSIVVVSRDFYLYHVVAPGRAIRYGVAVGTDELIWRGRATIGRKAEWPSWTPTPQMIERSPDRYARYADGMPGGPQNPLGARALYLYDARGNDTAIRIHGTTEPGSIGRAVSNGCLRMRNEAVMALYEQVPIGTPVYVY